MADARDNFDKTAASTSDRLRHRIERNPDLLVITAEGAVTQAERVAHIRSWLAEPEYHPGMPILCDFTDAVGTPTMSELHELVELFMHNAEAIGRKKIAVVASKPITHGVARQFAMFAAPLPLDIEVFASHEKAVTWLFAERR